MISLITFILQLYLNTKIMSNIDMLYFIYITFIFSTDSTLNLIAIINIYKNK